MCVLSDTRSCVRVYKVWINHYTPAGDVTCGMALRTRVSLYCELCVSTPARMQFRVRCYVYGCDVMQLFAKAHVFARHRMPA